LIYTDSEKGKLFVLRIESLEIDDHTLDKIESGHGVSLEERRLYNKVIGG
jgi:hypothetical protein